MQSSVSPSHSPSSVSPSVCTPTQIHSKQIAKFQYNMAKQTQNMTLDLPMVEKAVSFLIAKQEFGQYWITCRDGQTEEKEKNQQKEIGRDRALSSLLITYQNKESWWIQSVYVRQEERRKGLFTLMFKHVVSQGKKNKAKKIQLFVQKQNIKAKKTYESLGMYYNNTEFYHNELVYKSSDTSQVQSLYSAPLNPSLKQVPIQPPCQPQNLPVLIGKWDPLNLTVSLLHEQKPIGQFQYFRQFSDWRFGLMLYVNYFSCCDQKLQQIAFQNCVKYLYQSKEANLGLKVGSIRVIVKTSDEGFGGKDGSMDRNNLERIGEFLHRDVYDVMQIDL